MLAFVERKYPEILRGDSRKRTSSATELDEKMKKALQEFAEVFQAVIGVQFK